MKDLRTIKNGHDIKEIKKKNPFECLNVVLKFSLSIIYNFLNFQNKRKIIYMTVQN